MLNNGFVDIFLGTVQCDAPLGDFIVRRKDGLFAYQLAVVVDDIYQEISHVIRGTDLLDSTPSQIFLFNCLHASPPQFGHLPLVLNPQGQKLSKQHGATALNDNACADNLRAALRFLNHEAPKELSQADVDSVLQWAIEHWNRFNVPTHNAKPDQL